MECSGRSSYLPALWDAVLLLEETLVMRDAVLAVDEAIAHPMLAVVYNGGTRVRCSSLNVQSEVHSIVSFADPVGPLGGTMLHTQPFGERASRLPALQKM
jgi:hypothetical protein